MARGLPTHCLLRPSLPVPPGPDSLCFSAGGRACRSEDQPQVSFLRLLVMLGHFRKAGGRGGSRRLLEEGTGNATGEWSQEQPHPSPTMSPCLNMGTQAQA